MTHATTLVTGLVLGWCLASGQAVAAGYGYAAVNVPGAIDTEPYGINDKGIVVGTYTDPGFGLHGFQYDPVSGAFTTIDAPIANRGTIVRSIDNQGRIYGYCFPAAGGVQDFILTSKGFKLMPYRLGGAYYYLEGASANGLLDTGYVDLGGILYGYVQQPGHKKTLLEYQANSTMANGVNNAGLVVGTYVSFANGLTYGFTYQGGTYVSVAYPGVAVTILTGANDLGQDVGVQAASSVSTSLRHGFLFANGVFTDLPDPPGTTYGTVPTRINNKGVIAGFAKTQPGAFVYGGGFILTPTP